MADDIKSQNLYKQAKESANSASEAQKKIADEVKTLSEKVPQALKDADHKMLEHYAKALRGELTAISTSLQDIRTGYAMLEQLDDDEKYVADHQKELKDMAEALDTLRNTLTHQYESVEDLEKQVKDNLKNVKATKEDFFDEVAKHDEWISGTLKMLKDSLDKAETVTMAIDSAVSDRDAKALASAQKSMKEIDSAGLTASFDHHEKDLKELLKKIDERGFDAKVTTELKDSVNDLQERIEKGRKGVKELEDEKKDGADAKIEAVNIKDAMKTLELPAKAEPKLTKVLRGPPKDYEKGLNEIAKESGKKTTGRQMLNELEKEGVV